MPPSREAKFYTLRMEPPINRQDQSTAQQSTRGNCDRANRMGSALHQDKARAPDCTDEEEGEVGHGWKELETRD